MDIWVAWWVGGSVSGFDYNHSFYLFFFLGWVDGWIYRLLLWRQAGSHVRKRESKIVALLLFHFLSLNLLSFILNSPPNPLIHPSLITPAGSSHSTHPPK